MYVAAYQRHPSNRACQKKDKKSRRGLQAAEYTGRITGKSEENKINCISNAFSFVGRRM